MLSTDIKITETIYSCQF